MRRFRCLMGAVGPGSNRGCEVPLGPRSRLCGWWAWVACLVVPLLGACEDRVIDLSETLGGGDADVLAVDSAPDSAERPETRDAEPSEDTAPPRDTAEAGPTEVLPGDGGADDVGDAAEDTGDDAAEVGPEDTAPDVPPSPPAPVLIAARANQTGISGLDLRVAFDGTDADRNTRFMRLRLFSGEVPAAVFPVAETGLMTHEAVLPFDVVGEVFGRETFQGRVTVRGLFRAARPTRALVELLDTADQASAAKEIEVVLQPLVGAGEACDPQFLANRCNTGLVCRGSRCQNGAAPYVSRLSYFVDSGGPRVLLEGTEPENDLVTIIFTYYNALGEQVAVDFDEDGEAETFIDERYAVGLAYNELFFLRFDVPPTFPDAVAEIGVVAIDSLNQQSEMRRTRRTIAPTRGTNQVCDPRGFDLCGPNDACLLATDGAMRCQVVEEAREKACQTSPFLPLDGTPISGVAFGPSMFDPPPMCAANDSIQKSEGLARIRLSSRTGRVVISTDHPGTRFDTVLYVVSGCGDSAAPPLACVDDIPGPPTRSTSTVTLENVGAGDYLIIVDAWGEGGDYQVSARIESTE